MFRLFPRIGPSCTLLATFAYLSVAVCVPALAQTHTLKGYVYQTLYSFSALTPVETPGDGTNYINSDGANPYASLIMDSDGNLYGTAYNGGSYGIGTVFQYAPVSNTFTTLHNFTGENDGGYPCSGLIMDSSGNLYGTASNGGAGSNGNGLNGSGTLFQYALSTSAFTVLQSFDVSNGSSPYGGLIMDSRGNLYGTTEYGAPDGQGTGGSIFQYALTTNTFTTLYSFIVATEGSNPMATLMMDSNGNLYGTTEYGGGGNNTGTGALFEYTPATNTFSVFHSFSNENSEEENSDGGNPYSGPIMDASGNLYGTTAGGGANGHGTLFKYSLTTNTFTTLYTFSATTVAGNGNHVNSDGDFPSGNLIMDDNGNLYGTTRVAGAYGGGTIYRYAPATNTFTTLYNFGTNANDGWVPYSGLLMNSDGALYGTTYYGGVNGYGAIFVLRPVDTVVPPTGLHHPQGSNGVSGSPGGGTLPAP